MAEKDRPLDPAEPDEQPESNAGSDDDVRMHVPEQTRDDMLEEDRFESTDN